jgi:hypothetical protein
VTDEELQRMFDRASVGPDGPFVARVMAEVTSRRDRRRAWGQALGWTAGVLCLGLAGPELRELWLAAGLSSVAAVGLVAIGAWVYAEQT